MITNEQLALLDTLMTRQIENPLFFSRMMTPEEYEPLVDDINRRFTNTIGDLLDASEGKGLTAKAQVTEIMTLVMMQMSISVWIGLFIASLRMTGLTPKALADSEDVVRMFNEHIELLQSEFLSMSMDASKQYLNSVVQSTKDNEEEIEPIM